MSSILSFSVGKKNSAALNLSLLSTTHGGDTQVEHSKWGLNTCNNYGARAMWGMPVVMRIDYLLLHNYAHSIEPLYIMPARCLKVRNYYCHFVCVLQKPRVSETSVFSLMCVRFCAVSCSSLSLAQIRQKTFQTQVLPYREMLYIHLCFISIIKRRHYVTKWGMWVKI